MSTEAATGDLIQKIKDDHFNVDHISRYHLLLKLDETKLKFCITDDESGRCLFLEHISLDKSLSSTGRIGLLERIYDEHHFLKAGFWKSVKLVISSRHFTFIPAPLFDPNELESYLSLSTRFQPELDELAYYAHQNSEAVCAFSINRQLAQWFRETYPSIQVQFIHNTSPLIEGALHNTMPDLEKQLFLFADEDQLTGIVTYKGKLEFCNVFTFNSPEEFLYYVLWIMRELEMDPNSNNLILFGEVTEESPLYKKLYEYVRNIGFGDKPSFLKFSYQFDEVNDHRYLDLYCMHLCK